MEREVEKRGKSVAATTDGHSGSPGGVAHGADDFFRIVESSSENARSNNGEARTSKFELCHAGRLPGGPTLPFDSSDRLER